MVHIAATISILFACLLGIFGIYFSKPYIQSSGSFDWFLTARQSQSWWSVALGMLAASSGSWVLFLPSKMASDPSYGSAGLIILGFYTIAASYPILLIAYVGDKMLKKYPTIRSMADYARLRFGKAVANYISCICITNTGIGLVAEYSAIAKLFSYFHSSRIIPVVCIGFSSLMLTTFGGLPTSLGLTRYLMMMNIVLVIIVVGYGLSTIDLKSSPETADGIHLTPHGISTIVAMLISYQSLFVFADGMWQRVIASESRDALRKGALVGTLLTLTTILSIGLTGYLGVTSGLVSDPRVSFVGIFTDAPGWIILCIMLLSVFMSQGLIISLQHSFTASVMSLYSSLGFENTIASARITSIFLHIPLILIGIIPMQITELFLIASILSISSVLPLLIGLIPQLDHYVNGSSVLMGCAFSLMSIFIFGFASTGCYINGIFRVLFDEYSWEPFGIALVSSLIGVGLCVLIEIGLYSCAGRPYISDMKLEKSLRSHHSYQPTVQDNYQV